MITIDEALQRLCAQVSKASIHKSVCTAWLLDNKEDYEGFKIRPLKQLFQADGSVLLRFAVEEDLMTH